MPDLMPGQVTIADLYRELLTIRTGSASMLAEMKVMATWYETHRANLADHETRIRSLEVQIPDDLGRRLGGIERWQWRAGGIVTAVAAVVGIVSGLLTQLVSRGH